MRARYKGYDYTQTVLVPVAFEHQLLPGTLEFAIQALVERRMDTVIFDSLNSTLHRIAAHWRFGVNPKGLGWAANGDREALADYSPLQREDDLMHLRWNL